VANLIFYLMATLAVVAAGGVVLCRNPVNSVLSLLASFFALATIYLLAGFQFIAAAQILVYAGAILVLFLFVIMLLNLAHEEPREVIDLGLFRRRKSVWAGIVVAGLLILTLAAVQTGSGRAAAVSEPPLAGYDTIDALAGALFGRYILPFEAVSLLLLATTVAVVVLAKRERGPGRRHPSAAQVSVENARVLSAEQYSSASEDARPRATTSVGGAP
jgi:NADH-quinone oxidoreductase subunit J